MKLHTVVVYARRGDERLTATISTNAEDEQDAIRKVVGIHPTAYKWYSLTYRQDLGYIPLTESAKIISYEVMQ